MPNELTSKRPKNITPEAEKKQREPLVHPLLRKPAPPPDPSTAQPARRVTYTFVRPARSQVTWALIAINLVVFALTELVPSQQDTIFFNFANQPLAVLDQAQYWRLFTSMFLHANLAHVLLNMLVLRSLGGLMERAFGHVRFILVYLLGGLAGSIMSAALNEPWVYSVGASGAVLAIIGVEAAHLYNNWRTLGPAAKTQLRQVLLLAAMEIGVGFLGNFSGGGLFLIDNWAHLGGFLGGFALAYLIGPRYTVTPNADNTEVVVRDLRPLSGQIGSVVLFTVGLIVILLAATGLR